MRLRARPRGEVSLGVIVAGVLFVLALLAVVLYFVKFRGTVPVPEVVGMSWTEARDAVLEGRLKPARENLPTTGGGKAGIVSSQEPLGGSRRKPGSTVTLSVPGGADLVMLPSLLGLSASAARSHLRRLGLEYAEQGRKTDARRAGTIVEQDPKGGSEILKGSTVRCYISSGAGLRTVPDLKGKSQAVAEDLALKDGFTLEVVGEESRSGSAPGQVVQQIPPPKSRIDPTGAVIKVTIRSQTDDRAPRLTGQTVAEARKRCSLLKMDLRVEEGEDNDKHVVVRQDPPPGAPVFGGIAVTTRPSLIVPELVGESLQDAYDMADQAGVALSVVEGKGEGEAGVILTQNIPAGSAASAMPRTTVRVEVARMKPPQNPRKPKESK